LCGCIQDFLPELLASQGKPAHLEAFINVKPLSTGLFEERDVFSHLSAHISSRLLSEPCVAKRGIEDKQRNVEISCLDLVPLQHRAADIVAADEHVGFRQASYWSPVYWCAGNISPGIGAQIGTVAHGLRLFAQVAPHVGCADHGAVILRVYGDHIHYNERLHRSAAGNPGNFLSIVFCRFGIYIVLEHDVPHLAG